MIRLPERKEHYLCWQDILVTCPCLASGKQVERFDDVMIKLYLFIIEEYQIHIKCLINSVWLMPEDSSTTVDISLDAKKCQSGYSRGIYLLLLKFLDLNKHLFKLF